MTLRAAANVVPFWGGAVRPATGGANAACPRQRNVAVAARASARAARRRTVDERRVTISQITATAVDRDAQRGVSLVELIVLLAATTVLVCALLAGIVSMNAERQVRDEEMLAFDACHNVLEDLRSKPIAEIAAANGQGFAVVGASGFGVGLQPRPGDADGRAGFITVTSYRVYGTNTLYRVTVGVDWAGATPKGHVQITTL